MLLRRVAFPDFCEPEGIHIFTVPWLNDTPFRLYFPHELRIDRYGGRYCDLDEKNRIEKFAHNPKA
jgi:hypothetical protein